MRFGLLGLYVEPTTRWTTEGLSFASSLWLSRAKRERR
jgi:hypothetical protein